MMTPQRLVTRRLVEAETLTGKVGSAALVVAVIQGLLLGQALQAKVTMAVRAVQSAAVVAATARLATLMLTVTAAMVRFTGGSRKPPLVMRAVVVRGTTTLVFSNTVAPTAVETAVTTPTTLRAGCRTLGAVRAVGIRRLVLITVAGVALALS